MSLLAIVVVRNGIVPTGGEEAIAEANGRGVLVGSLTGEAAKNLSSAHTIFTMEMPGSCLVDVADGIAAIDPVRRATGVILPASPDGRDLAPLLAHRLHRPLFASATEVREHRVTCVRTAGRVGRELIPPGPFVATLVPGVRGLTRSSAFSATAVPTTTVLPSSAPGRQDGSERAVTSIAVLPPDPTTMDLTEARFIVGGGLGLGSRERFDQLARVGRHLGASLGGTRVASDAGWIPFERQIGTTGVAVTPSIYLAFGISGATQHTSGLGDPDHVISVNTDPSCPMMTMADLAIVSDAAGVLDALERRLRDMSND